MSKLPVGELGLSTISSAPNQEETEVLENLISTILSDPQNTTFNTRDRLLSSTDPRALLFWGRKLCAAGKKLLQEVADSIHTAEIQARSPSTPRNSPTTTPRSMLARPIRKENKVSFLLNRALEAFSNCKDADPKNPGARYWIAYTLQKQAKFNDKRKLIDVSFRLYQKACENYKDAFLLDPTEPKCPSKWVRCIEQIAILCPSSNMIHELTDSFLLHFGSYVMGYSARRDEKISLKPLIALTLSKSQNIQKAKPLDLLKHLSSHSNVNLKEEAQHHLKFLTSILNEEKKTDWTLENIPNPVKALCEDCKITDEMIAKSPNALMNMISWLSSKEATKVSTNTLTQQITDEESRNFYDVLFIFENPKPQFTIESEIRVGEHGSVLTGKRKLDSFPVIIKTIKDYRSWENHIRDEVWIVKSCDHPNLVYFIDAFYFENEVWIVSDYCRGGTLSDLITIVPLKEPMIAYITREILKGLTYLHKKCQIHRDLKSESILVNFNGDIKIADLDLCEDLMTPKEDDRVYLLNPRLYIPPEMLLLQPYSTKVDIWSLGCVVFHMTTGFQVYFNTFRLKGLYSTALHIKPQIPDAGQISPNLIDFIDICLEMDQFHRPSADVLIEHPFIRTACDSSEISKVVEIAFWFSTGE
eukprot:TRINITY_DN5431_c0_g2_i1.p1 TRINITY_DN5431_c0_g2~~TRINITY_DN5431_c0_g2_i1.p1  ORF type:complete len:656 (+),score=98.18 TRINITY_DN5431_c0_g2_i1:41-1969(+)